MKKLINILLVSLLMATTLTVRAQKKPHKNGDRWKKYQTEKIAFLTSNLELTPAEAEKFWPIYNQMDKERWEVQKARHELEAKIREAEEALSDKEVIQLTRDFAGNMQKEGGLLVKYNEKFLAILPPQKVLKLYQTENEFRMHMIKMYRDGVRNAGKE